jgi:hypothetical protein
MTARSLMVASTGTATGYVNVLNHDKLDADYSPAVKTSSEELAVDESLLLDDDYAAPARFAALSTFTSMSELNNTEEDAVSAAGTEEDEMHAAVRQFFELYDHARVGETDELVQKYVGREDELMRDLQKEYPEEAEE